MRALTTQAILTSFSSRADKSLGFRGVTPELTSKEKAQFMELQNINLRMLLEPMDFEPSGKDEVKGVLDSKSPSTRLRGVLYVLWKQQTESGKMQDKSWELFYVESMERMISDIKSQLEPE